MVPVYQVRLELEASQPKVWRRLLVPADTLLSDLHKILQSAMGWTNSHLHQFIKDKTFYEPPSKNESWGSYGVDYSGMKLKDFLKKEKEIFHYEYDFGDGWQHQIKLEKIITDDKSTTSPVCIDGAMACPPEDCGGIWGFQELKKIMSDPDHPEHEDYVAWYGGVYDPTTFDIEKVNKTLKKSNFGVIEW